MHLAPRHASIALLLAAQLACAPTEPANPTSDAAVTDASADGPAPSDVAIPDAPPPTDVAPPTDAASVTDATAPTDRAPPTDVAAPADVAAPTDVVAPSDVPAARDVVAPADVVAPTDVPAPRDVITPSDVPAPTDVPAPRDVITPSDVPAPRDVITPSDIPAPSDVVTPADAGTCATARIVAPAAAEVIETCSESGAPVFYTFRADVTGSPTRVDFAFRTPAGDLAPPAPAPLTAAPWSVRRQVGGMMIDAPPLAVFPNALRGTWNLEVTVTDRCGRTTVSQPFTLTFTTRRCPNP